MNNFGTYLVVIVIRFYRYFVSPMTSASCRFSPTCSQYAIDAFVHYGILKGFYLTGIRILRCNPWNNGGFDPVPKYKRHLGVFQILKSTIKILKQVFQNG